jgi:YD repeat-containing protein
MTRVLFLLVLLAYAVDAAGDPLFPQSGELGDACRVEDNWFGERTRVRRFDPAGRLRLEEADNGNDGIIDQTLTYTFDAAGRLLRVEDPSRPGHYEAHYHARDSAREWIKTVTDWPATQVTHLRRIDRDPAGRVLREVLLTGTPVAARFDRRWEYDASGSPTGRTDYAFTSSRGWELEWVHALEHDAAGRVVAQRSDRGGDGTIDAITLYEYDDSGRLLGSVTDDDADGTWDWSYRRAYDDERRIVRELIDWDNDGEADVRVVHFFECEGR